MLSHVQFKISEYYFLYYKLSDVNKCISRLPYSTVRSIYAKNSTVVLQ
nr:MAG TPA: hypothetical protein [Caudoviricetes sp.]